MRQEPLMGLTVMRPRLTLVRVWEWPQWPTVPSALQEVLAVKEPSVWPGETSSTSDENSATWTRAASDSSRERAEMISR